MRVFLRTFNNKINSKSGSPLADRQYRGTPEWLTFQNLLIDCLSELGHATYCQLETPLIEDCPGACDRQIFVHQTKREKPSGDLFWMQMHMRNLFTIDTNGWGADASNNDFKLGDINEEEATQFCQVLSKNLCDNGTSKIDQPRETSTTPERFILVPLQIPRDYTIRHHSPVTVRYFIDSLMAWAEERGKHICIKMHPFNKGDRDLHEAVDQGAESSGFVHKVEGNIHELIKRSSGVFVINSGTGFEALIHGKPVATFGACDYNRVTFNADLRRIDEAWDFTDQYSGDYRGIAYQFLYWYYTKHAYDINREDTKQRLTQYLKENL